MILWLWCLAEAAAGAYLIARRPAWRRRTAGERPRFPAAVGAGGAYELDYAAAPVERRGAGRDVPPLRVVRATYAAAAAVPWGATALVAAALIHARLTLGAWPTPAEPRTTLPAGWAFSAALCGCPLTRLLLTAGTIYLLCTGLRDRRVGGWLALHALGSAAATLALWHTGFVAWLTA